MNKDGSNDFPGAPGGGPTETGERYRLTELAEMLDAPVEKLRQWLTDEDIHPTHPDYPEDYGVDAMEFVRLRRHSL